MSDQPVPPDVQQFTLPGLALVCTLPVHSRLIEFARPNGSTAMRVVVELEQERFRYDIERLPDGADPHALAESFFKSNEGQPEDVAPSRWQNSAFEAWRTRRVFVNGLTSVMVFDALFIRVRDGVFRIQYAARAADYPKGKAAFEQMITSLTPVEGSLEVAQPG